MPRSNKKPSVEVIPSINVDEFSEAKKRIKKVEPFVKWVHLDVSDGKFTKHVSWNNPKDIANWKPKVKVEVHLMIEKPEKTIDKWLVKGISRVIFHEEATKEHKLIIDKIHKAKKEAGVAIKPKTNWLRLFPYFNKVEVLQLLAVNPGPSGQKFNHEIIHKLGHIKSICPECTIEIDGGVNQRVAKRCIAEGANLLVSGSTIFESKNIKKIILSLKKS